MDGVALVTGAARGIGAACVHALVAQGWRVVALDRCEDDPRLPYALGSERELTTVVTDANAATEPGRAIAVKGDAASIADAQRAVELAEERFGGLDAVVSVAGVIAGGRPLWEMPEHEQEAVLDGNFRVVVSAARAGIPALLRRAEPRRGRFVAVASAAATRGLPLLAAYCGANAAVVGLVRAIAAELDGTGVTANTISPGSTRTAILEESARLYDLANVEELARHQAIGRLIEPSEVAQVVAFVAGPGGAVLTGTDLHVDGGLTM